ncbi:hypothetical protein KHS38_01800 [Mucilaginibacter sp. Bleaf8]|uniref:hypothetical protein n=1 Tax=Mucilaginibacter sp. Bleaf8 TaxID=2834430 RepID=UPI001BCBB7E5|nr:hypothetical protein [Mucilaginibacter sp. Bleaf8]MBS7563126.1 hypothetical protein [Mucilaginibacter sp. Bleaf8]
MSGLPIGIYLEDEKRFEFDFVKHLLKISFFKETKPAGTIVSPFRLIKNEESLYLLIHNYDRLGERKIMIESIDQNQLVINHDNTSYKLQKVA